MNWAYFIGCKVKVHNWEGKLYGIELDSHLIISDNGRIVPIHKDNCKPILRPLSSMTEEEKVEMQKLFYKEHGQVKELILDVDKCVIVRLKKGREFHCNTIEILWLMSKGFYVNQCEPEECIIEEG